MEIEDDNCDDCGGYSSVQENENGEMECKDCGLISGVAIDYGKDNRVFADGSGMESERWGQPATNLLHDKGLTTDIDWRNRDSSGAPISSKTAALMRKVRTQHKRTRIRNATERNLSTAIGELQRLASQMALPHSMREEAAYIYRKAVEKKLVRGRSIEGVVAASLYAACRIRGQPRTLDEVGFHSRTGRKEIGRTYRAIVKSLLLPVQPAYAEGYIPRFCATLQVPQEVSLLSMRLVENAEKHGLVAGRGPTGLAAAAVYLACAIKSVHRTQREVAVAAGVTEVTIRNRFKEMCEAYGINPDTPSKWVYDGDF